MWINLIKNKLNKNKWNKNKIDKNKIDNSKANKNRANNKFKTSYKSKIMLITVKTIKYMVENNELNNMIFTTNKYVSIYTLYWSIAQACYTIDMYYNKLYAIVTWCISRSFIDVPDIPLMSKLAHIHIFILLRVLLYNILLYQFPEFSNPYLIQLILFLLFSQY